VCYFQTASRSKLERHGLGIAMESGPFRLTEKLVADGELIRTDGYKLVCDSYPGLAYRKRDFLFRPGYWRGDLESCHLGQGFEALKKTLVVGHSDKHTGYTEQLALRLAGVPRLWGTNIKPWAGFSRPLPLGLTNFERDSQGHKLLSDDSHLVKAISNVEHCMTFRPEVYINFTVSNNKDVRSRVKSYFENSGFSSIVSDPDFSEAGRVEYLRRMRTSALTPCPEGNGVDTHRLWECLYVGGTPVVVRNTSMQPLYNQLPLVQLNSWSEISDMDKIADLWEQSRTKRWNHDVLTLSHWTKLLLESAST
jgi:hypothetical protein